MLIKLVDMGFNWRFSDSHCRYIEPIGGPDVNKIGRHGFQL